MLFTDVRPALDALIARLADFGDQDMVDLLKAYKLGKSHECSCNGCKETLADAAQQMRDEAERVAEVFEQAADYHHGGYVSYTSLVRQ
jgi:pyruvate-formate lyase-activating enzyme